MLEEEYGALLHSVEEFQMYHDFTGYSKEYDHYIDMYDLYANDQRHIKIIDFI
jgi:hypothetical protein